MNVRATMSRLGAPLGAVAGFAVGFRAGRAGRAGRTGHAERADRVLEDSPQDISDGHEHGDEPAPDAADKPDSPADVTTQSWRFVARKTLGEFSKDQCTDLAAALTYYAVLALFPAAIALLSLVGLVGQGAQTVDTLLQILRDLGAGSVATTLEPTLALAEPGVSVPASLWCSACSPRCGRPRATSTRSGGR